MIQVITENSIKQVMLRYLKNHYKYRLGDIGKIELKRDQRSADGLIADGYISFLLDDKTPFLATFEATSFETKEEVTFRRRSRILTFDAFSFGLFIITLIYTILYYLNHLSLKTHTIWYNLGFLFGGIILFGLLYFLLFRNNFRYRYIYAIEQFKQYFADDQWIAIGEDVFENPEEVELEELKRQCVLNGFGLVVVDRLEQPQLIISPARQTEFRAKKQEVLFVNREETLNQRTIRNVRSLWGRFKNIFKKSTYSRSMLRFQSIAIYRVLMLGLGVGMLGYIFWKQYSDKDHIRLDNTQWQKEISEIDGSKEGTYYMAGKENTRPFEDTPSNYLDLLPEEGNNPIDPELSNIEMFLASDSRLFTYYDCTRLYNFDQKKYIIKWRSFSEFEQSKEHVVRLMQKGIRCNVIWHGCFRGDEEGYIVFLDILFNTREKATQKGNFLKAWLAQEDEEIDEMAVLVLRQ